MEAVLQLLLGADSQAAGAILAAEAVMHQQTCQMAVLRDLPGAAGRVHMALAVSTLGSTTAL